MEVVHRLQIQGAAGNYGSWIWNGCRMMPGAFYRVGIWGEAPVTDTEIRHYVLLDCL